MADLSQMIMSWKINHTNLIIGVDKVWDWDAAIPEWYAEKTARLFDGIEQPMQMLSPHKNAKQSATALWAGVHGICILTLRGKLNISPNDTALMIIDTMLDNFIMGYAQAHAQL